MVEDAWREGPDLPVETVEATAVPYKNTFLLVGSCTDVDNKILRFVKVSIIINVIQYALLADQVCGG